MDKPHINKSLVYSIIADTMPMEGRDFVLDTKTGEDGKTVLSVTPLTDIGKAFVPELIKRLGGKSSEGGFIAVSAVAEKSEVLTIASIRANIEKETVEVLKRRIASAAETGKKKKGDLESAAKENNAEKIREARMAINAAEVEENKARRTLGKLENARKAVEDRAIAAAKDDETRGVSWAVDMDAPLTSLFDRQDVSEKIRNKELLIMKSIEHENEAEDDMTHAADILRQYVIHKEV